MLALYLIPFIFGAVVCVAWLRERDLLVALPGAFGIGVLGYLGLVNALLYRLPMRTASLGALALLAVLLGLAVWRRPERVALRRPAWGGVLALGLVAGAVGLFTLLRLWRDLDDDLWVHAPLIASLQRGEFPPRNTILPDLAHEGHYGRDLLVAAVSETAGMDAFDVCVLTAVVLQIGQVVLLGALGRRFLGSRWAGLGLAFFVFLCAEAGFGGDPPLVRHGLLEVMTNNNPLVYFGLFVLLYLLPGADRRPRWATTVLRGGLLGVYAIVYETHYAVLVLVFGAAYVARALRPARGATTAGPRARAPRLHLAAVLVVSALLAVVQGGPLTSLARGWLRRADAGAEAGDAGKALETVASLSQQVAVRFPKSPFLEITTHQGENVSVVGSAFVARQGWTLWLAPLAAVVCWLTRRWFGLLSLGLAATFLLLPACVDFGRYNAESFRFVFAAAVAASLGCGVAWHRLVVRAAAVGTPGCRVLAAALLLAPLGCAGGGLREAAALAAEAWSHPERFHADPYRLILERLPIRPIDLAAAAELRPWVRPGDRMLTGLAEAETRRVGQYNQVRIQSVMAAVAGCPIVGHGLYVPSGPWRMTIRRAEDWWIRTVGYRKMAFWHTLDPRFLEELKVTLLCFDPAELTPSARVAIRARPELERVLVVKGGNGWETREVWRVRWPGPPADTAPGPLCARLKGVELPAEAQAGDFVWGRAYLVAEERLSGSWRVAYRLTDVAGGAVVNAAEPLWSWVTLRSEPGDVVEVRFAFVASLWPGEFEVELQVAGPAGELVRLKSEEGARARVRVRRGDWR